VRGRATDVCCGAHARTLCLHIAARPKTALRPRRPNTSAKSRYSAHVQLRGQGASRGHPRHVTCEEVKKDTAQHSHCARQTLLLGESKREKCMTPCLTLVAFPAAPRTAWGGARSAQGSYAHPPDPVHASLCCARRKSFRQRTLPSVELSDFWNESTVPQLLTTPTSTTSTTATTTTTTKAPPTTTPPTTLRNERHVQVSSERSCVD
jgi:hypothetical protein